MTQAELIIEYIKNFGSITPMDAYLDLGITKLATRISEMKARGFEFKTETVKSQNRFGKPTHYCKYTLVKEGQ